MAVIFHIDENEKWNLLLANVKNLAKVIDDTSQIEVLANGKAVQFYLNQNELMKELHQLGVQFMACENSLKSHHIDKKDLVSIVKTVKVGVYELMIKQQEGYSYIKP